MDNASYHGFIATTDDALLMFEACRQNIFPRRRHRLNEIERNEITSGSIFVWDETESGIRRWTDGKRWSPSRVNGCFLSYIELKPKSYKKKQSTTCISCKHSYSDIPMEDDLVKKSLSLFTKDNHKLHLVCYYCKKDVDSGILIEPSRDPRLRSIKISQSRYPEFLSDNVCVDAPHCLPAKKRRLSVAPAATRLISASMDTSQTHHPMLLPSALPEQIHNTAPVSYRCITTFDPYPDRLKHNQISLSRTTQAAPTKTSPRQRHIMPILSRSARRSPPLMIQSKLVPRQQQYGGIPNTQPSSNCQFNAHVRINYATAHRSLSNPTAQDNAASVLSQPLIASTSNPVYKRKTLANMDSLREFVAPVFVSRTSDIGSEKNKESCIKLPPISEIINSIDHNKVSPLASNDNNSQHHPVRLAQTSHTCFTSNIWDCQQYPQDVSGFAY